MSLNKKRYFNFVFVVVILFCLSLILLQNMASITGNAIDGNATSNVSVTNFFSVTFSSNLTSGISFGVVNVLPSTNINATQNYEGLSNGTEYYINISNDSNSNLDFCIQADINLTSVGEDILGLGNETYSNSTLTNSTDPVLIKEISLTDSYVKAGDNVAIGGLNYYRFWLDVPVAQPSGTYNNTISFKGVQTGNIC